MGEPSTVVLTGRPMIGRIDHVGYLAGDLEGAAASMGERLAVPIVKRFERPQFDLVGIYLGEGHAGIEIFTFTDPDLLSRRLGDAPMRLDHVAYEVADIEAVCAELRVRGVRFCGPDNREEMPGPVDLGGTLHVWTVPETSCGQSMQLMQLPAST
jgi:catechol 2,3-dioxygenase-like lactoylglutathione lyase family enzyme